MVDKAPQIGLPFRVGPVGGQQLAAFVLANVIANDITQHAHEDIVHRVRKSFAHAELLIVFPFLKIGVGVHAATSEEGLRTARVTALHGGIEHGLQAAISGGGEMMGRPLGQGILGSSLSREQLGARPVPQAAMQLFDDVEVSDQSPQLGGRAQLQLGSGIDVERLVQAVGMDPQVIPVHSALVENDAPSQPRRVLSAEQIVSN